MISRGWPSSESCRGQTLSVEFWGPTHYLLVSTGMVPVAGVISLLVPQILGDHEDSLVGVDNGRELD
jgi:hypothetical protein